MYELLAIAGGMVVGVGWGSAPAGPGEHCALWG